MQKTSEFSALYEIHFRLFL